MTPKNIIESGRQALLSTILISSSVVFANAAEAASIKVAFTGDQGIGSNSQAVLSLIASEGADLLMIQGDLGYKENAAITWDANITNALGENFPVLVVVGNHENFEWPLYQRLIQKRMDRAAGLSCSGELGVKATCTFDKLEVVHVAPGVAEVAGVNPDDDYGDFIRSSFSGNTDRWRICSWHKNQNALQTGSKGNSTGWDVYDACLDAGAMVALAHEHAYSRTYLLSDFENQTIVHKNSDMTLEPGKSFAFVSGLGGREVRPQQRGGDWWASIYTANQNATHGALFCTFEDSTADCYFKAIDGAVPDQFKLRRGSGGSNTNVANTSAPSSAVTPSPAVTASSSTASVPLVFSRTDKEELRWIDRDASGQLGSVWISSDCAASFGGPTAYGDWKDLNTLAPGLDAIDDPCSGAVNEARVEGSASTSSTSGYVFSRTDKNEYRWIDVDNTGGKGNIWISQACADSLGGPSQSGDWGDLNATAPGFDTVASPCAGGSPQPVVRQGSRSDGFVFTRTDVDEYRWVAPDASGVMANTWIDKACAERFGGASASGDWVDLITMAPGFDAIENPC